jgi:aldehyde dehydrogenase (NAD+)
MFEFNLDEFDFLRIHQSFTLTNLNVSRMRRSRRDETDNEETGGEVFWGKASSESSFHLSTAMHDIESLLEEQRAFFNTGQTKAVGFRAAQLKTLRRAVVENQERILDALARDLSKSACEAYLTEVGIVLDEIRFAQKHLKRWSRPERVRTPFYLWPASSYIYPEPYGIALIMAPWNYPFQLMVSPLVGSIGAGNCSVLKPSEYAPHTSHMLSELIGDHFRREYIAVVEGEADTGRALLEEPVDYIFFTGSTTVGKMVMEAAARHLTPLTLELGGKSPCIVDRDVDPHRAAKRIVSGKFINAGQTCIAPDYLLVQRSRKNELLDLMVEAVHQFYGDDPQQSPDYPRIINRKHFGRLQSLLQKADIRAGGRTDESDLYIAPTIVDHVDWTDSIMQEEIFGPILPVITYDDLSDVMSRLKTLPKPLALYIFSNNRPLCEKIIAEASFGGGCVNDTLIHFATPYLPFGGIGSSGLGRYHGKASFHAFSNPKAILKKSLFVDLPLRYPPYRGKLKFLKKILR